MHYLNSQILQTEQINSEQSKHNQINSIQIPLKISTNYTNHCINQTINVITRNRPQIDTYNRPITRRHRGPNKSKFTNSKMDDNPTRQPLITISTQTDEIDNTGKGRDPVQPELNPEIFLLSNNKETMPDYRKHLSQVFGEEFLAEATRQDRP